MFRWESRRNRRNGRDRRRPALTALEPLEGRELLAFTPLGFSLPDLSITGFTAPAGAWGAPLTVTVDVKNTGASTLIEPLALAPGAPSTADALPTTIAVYASPSPNPAAGVVQIGTIITPYIKQNSIVQLTQTLMLPNRPPGYPSYGGTIFVHFVVNPATVLAESDYTNNVSNTSTVLIEPPFPELAAVGLDVPPVMQPGDVIQPNIHIANLGIVPTVFQGPVPVALVASPRPRFGPRSSILQLYTLTNIPPVSDVPSETHQLGDATLDLPSNVATITGPPLKLPAIPKNYYIGVVIDPFNQIRQLHTVGGTVGPKPTFSLARRVGPPIRGLPPAGVVVGGGTANVQLFPFPSSIAANLGTTVGGFPFNSVPIVNYPQGTPPPT